MPNASSRLHFIRFWLERWGIYSLVGLIVMGILADPIATVSHPYNVQLLNATDQFVFNAKTYVYYYSPWISAGVAMIVVGLIASWQVHKARSERDQYKTENSQLKEDNRWLSEKYQLYKPLVDKMKYPRNETISAKMNLQSTTPEEIRLAEIQERFKRN